MFYLYICYSSPSYIYILCVCVCLRDEDVLELEIAVHDAERVQILDGQQHLWW